MKKMLNDLSVLFVGPESDQRDELRVYLPSEGALLSCCTREASSQDVARLKPAVVVVDLRQVDDAAEAELAFLRAAGATPQVPVLALIERGAAGSLIAARGIYNKYIAVPVHPGDIIAAIATLAAELDPAAAEPPAALTLAALLRERAERNDLRGFLALLNSTGPFRFTSILRFDEDEQLNSVWTFDRENRAADGFPLDATTPSSYCALVRESGTPFAMPDAATEPKAANHPKRHSVLSYCGVPLYDDEQSMIGTLCSYDLAPRYFADSTVQRLEETAAILQAHAPSLSRDRNSKI